MVVPENEHQRVSSHSANPQQHQQQEQQQRLKQPTSQHNSSTAATKAATSNNNNAFKRGFLQKSTVATYAPENTRPTGVKRRLSSCFQEKDNQNADKPITTTTMNNKNATSRGTNLTSTTSKISKAGTAANPSNTTTSSNTKAQASQSVSSFHTPTTMTSASGVAESSQTIDSSSVATGSNTANKKRRLHRRQKKPTTDGTTGVATTTDESQGSQKHDHENETVAAASTAVPSDLEDPSTQQSQPTAAGWNAFDSVLQESADLSQAAAEAQQLGRLKMASTYLLLLHARVVGLGKRLDKLRAPSSSPPPSSDEERVEITRPNVDDDAGKQQQMPQPPRRHEKNDSKASSAKPSDPITVNNNNDQDKRNSVVQPQSPPSLHPTRTTVGETLSAKVVAEPQVEQKQINQPKSNNTKNDGSVSNHQSLAASQEVSSSFMSPPRRSSGQTESSAAVSKANLAPENDGSLNVTAISASVSQTLQGQKQVKPDATPSGSTMDASTIKQNSTSGSNWRPSSSSRIATGENKNNSNNNNTVNSTPKTAAAKQLARMIPSHIEMDQAMMEHLAEAAAQLHAARSGKARRQQQHQSPAAISSQTTTPTTTTTGHPQPPNNRGVTFTDQESKMLKAAANKGNPNCRDLAKQTGRSEVQIKAFLRNLDTKKTLLKDLDLGLLNEEDEDDDHDKRNRNPGSKTHIREDGTVESTEQGSTGGATGAGGGTAGVSAAAALSTTESSEPPGTTQNPQSKTIDGGSTIGGVGSRGRKPSTAMNTVPNAVCDARVLLRGNLLQSNQNEQKSGNESTVNSSSSSKFNNNDNSNRASSNKSATTSKVQKVET